MIKHVIASWAFCLIALVCFAQERTIIKEAIEDHRASNEIEPRSIYGKIISSADRNISIDEIIKRTYAYRLKHNPSDTIKNIIEESRQHIIDKFGNSGYATRKMYFVDKEYEQFLKEVITLTKDKEKAKSSIRISLSYLTTKSEIEEFINIFDKCYKELKNLR